LGGGGVKFMKHFKGGASYKSSLDYGYIETGNPGESKWLPGMEAPNYTNNTSTQDPFRKQKEDKRKVKLIIFPKQILRSQRKVMLSRYAMQEPRGREECSSY
jgi:hypothetical protein